MMADVRFKLKCCMIMARGDQSIVA